MASNLRYPPPSLKARDGRAWPETIPVTAEGVTPVIAQVPKTASRERLWRDRGSSLGAEGAAKSRQN
jgi:hypothetical protein